MIFHLWSVLCQAVITDKETNGVSYIQAFHGVKLTGELPGKLPPITIGTAWRKDSTEAEKFRLRVTLEAPSGKKKSTDEISAEIPEESNNYRFNIRLLDHPVNESGMHFVNVEWKQTSKGKWKPAAILPLNIEISTPKFGDSIG